MAPTVERVVMILALVGEMPESELCDALDCTLSQLDRITVPRTNMFSWRRPPGAKEYTIFLYRD